MCAIKDAWSNRIVGYSIDERMKARLVVTAIDNAVARPGEAAGCTYHRRRRQAALGRLTPIEYEMINTPPATQAA